MATRAGLIINFDLVGEVAWYSFDEDPSRDHKNTFERVDIFNFKINTF